MTAATLESQRRSAGVAQSEEELVAAARTDKLMGILNRAAFDDIHSDLYASAGATGVSYGLCIIDLDRFKQYNDTYGHAAGDVVLRRVADALRSAVRPSDIIARYGGEEIVALLNGADSQSVRIPVTRMIERVSAMNIPHEHNGHGRVTVSVGAAAFDPSSAETIGELFERADKALYAAKSAGRNQFLIAA
jgi:diguanylate cyclase (GGDEF)-like protein